MKLNEAFESDGISRRLRSMQLSDGTCGDDDSIHEGIKTKPGSATGHTAPGTNLAHERKMCGSPSEGVNVRADGGLGDPGSDIGPVENKTESWSDAAERAMSCYEEADAIFSDVGAVRGRALIASHKACLLLLKEITPTDYWEEKDRAILRDIKVLLDTACQLFQACGDVMQFKLTQMHMSLLASQANDDVFEVQHKIGEWGSQSENWIFARQLGLLAFRFGDHLRYICGSIVRARWAYECVRHVLLKIPEQWTASFQLECAMTTLSLSTNDMSAGKLSLYIADLTFTRLSLEMSEAAVKAPAWDHAKQFFGMVLADLKISAAQKWETAENMRKICHNQLHIVKLCVSSSDEPSARIQAWLTEKSRLINAYALITEYEEDIDKGDWESGHAKLANHLARMPPTENSELELNLARVDILLKLQKVEDACGVLQTISGDEVLNEVSAGFAFRHGNYLSLYQRRRVIRALENVLQRCIDSRFWTRAFYVKALLEALCPDYFLFPGNYSHFLPWQRALWLGLMEEAQGKYDVIYHSFFQSWALFHTEWQSINSFDLRNSLVTHKDYDRIATSIARFFLRMNTFDNKLRQVPVRSIPDKSVRLVRRWNRSLDMMDWDLLSEALGALERGKALSMAQSLSFDAEASVKDIKSWDRTRHRFRVWLDLLSLRRPRAGAEEEEYQELNNATLEEELKSHPLHRMDQRALSEQVLG